MTNLSETPSPVILQPSQMSIAPLVQPKGIWLDKTVTSQHNAVTAQAVADGLGNSLRRAMQTDRQVTTVALFDALNFCALNYCGARDLSDELVDEMVDFCLTRFGGLGVGEVKEAFRLAAAGELGEIDMKAYYGTLTIGSLGEVLRKYQAHRDEIVRAIQKAETAQKRAEYQEKKANYWNTDEGKAEIMRNDENRLHQLKQMESPTVEDVTVYDYKILEKFTLIGLTKDEKLTLIEQAKTELRAWANKIRFRPAHVYEKDKAKRYTNGDFQGDEKARAQQIAVVNWINQNQQSKT
jgi:hypothetical protein